MKQYVIKTLGCKANFYDTQLLEQELQKRGWSPALQQEGEEAQADLCIVNSCTVTQEADRQSRKTAQRLDKQNPASVVVMTGCGAEVDPESMQASRGVDLVVGNHDKHRLVDLVLQHIESSNHSDTKDSPTETVQKTEPDNKVAANKRLNDLKKHPELWPTPEETFFLPLSEATSKTRSFLKIQEGCNSFCTYCIIPYGRGPSRSLPIQTVISQVQQLVAHGVKEVVFTGTNIGDYGTDLGLGYALAPLIQTILKETDLLRLRVSSLDPTEITPEILQLMDENPRFCPHFHVSLQSPHSRILKLMKRKYAFEQVKECLLRISKIKHVFVGMDIITGFPGETEEEFEWGYEALSNLPWSRLHVFPYSEREGTPATRLPHSVPQSIRVKRARRLNELSLERLKQVYRQALESAKQGGRGLNDVLIEKADPRGWTAGYTPHYIKVLIPPSESQTVQQNQLISAMPLELSVDSSSWDVGLVAKAQQ